MNTNVIYNLYKKIEKQNSGAHLVRFDLHIHSPGSNDFAAQNMDEERQFFSILNEAQENEIEIIAITDHNTFKGYNKLREILSRSSWNVKKEYQNILILCGIEITCYSNHILAIFDSDFSEDSQNNFLHEIGIDKDSEGTENAMADEFGPSKLLEKINDYGGITIFAHADSPKGFFYSYCRSKGDPKSDISFEGKSLAKIVKSPYLYGIQYCGSYGKSKIEQVLLNKDYRRKDRSLPFLKFSDSHGLTTTGQYNGKSGKPIGSCFSLAKLSYKSFNAIKMALTDPDVRIMQNEIKITNPYIIGCSIKSHILKDENAEYASFRFNSEMNCIIGARGTGKSTLLGIIQEVIKGNNSIYDSNDNEFKNSRYDEAVVFIYFETNIYAVAYNTFTEQKKVYIKSNRKFIPYNKSANFLRLFLTKGYLQRELYEYSLNSNKILDIIDDFLMWKEYESYGTLVGTINENLNLFNSKFNNYHSYCNKRLVDYINDENLRNLYLQTFDNVLTAKSKLFKMREVLVKELNRISKGKLKLSLTYKLNSDSQKYIIEDISERATKAAGKYYDYKISLQKFLSSIIQRAKIRNKFDFFMLLITNKNQVVINEYKLKDSKLINEYLNSIRNVTHQVELMIFFENGIRMDYNVNTGIEKTEAIYRPNYQLSLGQNAVALLLIILSASEQMNDNRPLIMDQPEDDLDNSYIFNTLVNEFRKSKSRRQIIISTHNANIPVSSDSENILVLQYNGLFGHLFCNGSLDNPRISKSVLDILEGGELAIRSRNNKYQNIR